MNVQKVQFRNSEGQTLVGRLELPVDRHPHNFALFAHCFTCSKNLAPVRNIGKALASAGYGLLRFDFTGLGESDGDFTDTNFSGNIEDLIAASEFLKREYRAPTLLIGHSLGGAAILMAADRIPSIQGMVSIAAPSNPKHVKGLLKEDLEAIESEGHAIVELAGREFTIKKQFLDDLEHHYLSEALSNSRTPLLLFHSPQDTIVGIKNAEEIYVAAHHPKSFVSLDGADHMLSDPKDSNYVGKVIASWAQRYISIESAQKIPETKHDVVASLESADGFTTQMKIGRHYGIADEPIDVGGNDFGPSPYEYLSAGLAACTAMTLQLYAKRKKWDLAHVEVHTTYGKSHAADCENCVDDGAKIDTFDRQIKIEGNLDDKQRKRLLEIADKCPVHKTLHSETRIVTELFGSESDGD